MPYIVPFNNGTTPCVSPSSSKPAPGVCAVVNVSTMIPTPSNTTPVHTHGPPANTPNNVANINNGAKKYRTLIKNLLISSLLQTVNSRSIPRSALKINTPVIPLSHWGSKVGQPDFNAGVQTAPKYVLRTQFRPPSLLSMSSIHERSHCGYPSQIPQDNAFCYTVKIRIPSQLNSSMHELSFREYCS